MYYLDYLRVRNAVRILALALAAWTIFVVVLLPFSHASGRDGTEFAGSHASGIVMLHAFGQTITIPFAIICTMAVTIAIVFSNALSTSLNRFNANLHFSFVKPVSRERAALTTFAIDAAGIVVAFAVALAFFVVPFAVVGLLDRFSFGSDSFAVAGIGLGIAFMWYGLVQAATATMRGSGGLVLGLSWAVFGVFASLEQMTSAEVPDVVVTAIHALNRLNPFTYFTVLFQTGLNSHVHLIEAAPTGSYVQSLAAVWIVALAALAFAVVRRARMEI